MTDRASTSNRSQRATLHPDCRESGSGHPMVLLHSSVSSNRQWAAFQTHFSGSFRTIAPNLIGYGGAVRVPPGQVMTLDDEVDQIRDLLIDPENPTGKVTLVGHSYGGAVGLKAALRYPERIARLILIEPNPFGMLAAERSYRFLAEIHQVYAEILASAASDEWDRSAELFSDYWSGPGKWNELDRTRQIAFIWGMPPVLHEWGAVFRDKDMCDGVRRVRCPTLLMWAQDTVPVVHELARLIRQAVPRWQTATIEKGGHMFPVTEAQLAFEPIDAFLRMSSP